MRLGTVQEGIPVPDSFLEGSVIRSPADETGRKTIAMYAYRKKDARVDTLVTQVFTFEKGGFCFRAFRLAPFHGPMTDREAYKVHGGVGLLFSWVL